MGIGSAYEHVQCWKIRFFDDPSEVFGEFLAINRTHVERLCGGEHESKDGI